MALLLYLMFDGLTSLYAISALFGLFQGGIVPSYAFILLIAVWLFAQIRGRPALA